MPSTTHPAPQAPAGLEHKAASASPESGLLEADDATGVVEAIVSVTGVLDEDRDVIKPGAYAKTLSRRRPKGIFVHDWSKWVARTEEIVELLPGDARLPKATKDGRPWPKEAGGLYVKARFNLDTEEGRAAYSNVKFFSETGECEWSVGYKVPPGKSTRTKTGERHIEEMDLFEYSPVLFGAAPLSGTLSVKSAAVADTPEKAQEATAGEALDDAEDVLDADELEELEAAAELEEIIDGEAEQPERETEQPGQDADPGDEPETTPAQGDPNAPETSPAEGEPTPEGKAIFSLKPPPTGDPMAVFREFRKLKTPDISDSAMLERLHATLFRLDEAIGSRDFEQARAQLEIVSQMGGSAGGGPARSFTDAAAALLRRASEATHSPFMKTAEGGDETKGMGTGLDRSPKKNWVEMAGKLPGYIEEIAKSIHEKRGLPLDQAIPIAIAQVKKWAAGGGDVDADTRAKAAKAVAQWEALKARSRARSAGKGATEELESTRYPFLPGSLEELREELRESATKTLNAVTAGVAHVEVMGTWPTRTVVTSYGYDGKAQAYELTYTCSDGQVHLADPVPVELKVTVDGIEEDGENLLPYPSVLESVTLDLKALLGHGESKAGRVLSALNEKRLLAAVESLVAVLRAAGLEVDGTPRTNQEQQEREAANQAVQHQDSTAPSARTTAATKVLMDPSLLARGYRLIGEAHALT